MTTKINKLTQKEKTEIKEIIKYQTEEYIKLSDFELRDKLSGYSFFSKRLLSQYYGKDTYKFKILKRIYLHIMGKLYKKAKADLKRYRVECEFKTSKKSKKSNHYSFELIEERNTEEALKRVKEYRDFIEHKNGILKIIGITEIKKSKYNYYY